MTTNAHVTLTTGSLSVTISKDEEEVELCAISGKYRSPKVHAYNLTTALRLLKGWFVLNGSWKEREEIEVVERVMFDELGGELMLSDKLPFIKYGEAFELVISHESSDEWVCINNRTKEKLYFKGIDDDFVRLNYFKKFEQVLE